MKQPVASTAISLDDVFRRCGDFSRFQWIHYFFLNLIGTLAGMVSLYYIYGAAEPKHRCRLPSQFWPNDNQYNPINSQHEIVLHEHIPMDNGQWDSCHLFTLSTSNRSLIDCTHGWVFDRDVFGFTFTEEASLVCVAKVKKSWIATLVQTAGFALLIIGALADRFGRKTTIITVNLLLFTICLIMQSVMQWIPMSINAKFGLLLTNQFASGLIFSSSTVVFVLSLELTTSTYRSLAGNIAVASFAFGGMLITLFAYVTHHWQKLLWIVTAFTGFTLPYLFYMPESPLYLYSTKQYSKLETLLRRIATINGRTDLDWYPLFKELLNTQPSTAINDEKLTFGHKVQQLLCHRTTTKRLLISSLLAFTGMLLYIKISYELATMNISPYLGILIGTLVEIVAYIVANILMSTRLSRKYSLMIFTSLTCVCVLLIPVLTKRSTLTTVIISQAGKFAISASLAITWIYIAELFPTSVRGSANGVATALSRLGAIVAPVVDSSIAEQYLPITFYVYGCIALFVLFLLLLLPETKNASLVDTANDTNHKDRTKITPSPIINSDDVNLETHAVVFASQA